MAGPGRGRRADWLETLRGAFADNLFYKLVALVAALAMWVGVQSDLVVQERVRVRLEWLLPDGLVTVEPALSGVMATVEGVQAYTRGVHQKELSMRVDLSGAREGDVSVDLSERPIDGLPPQVRVASLAPQTLQVKLDRVLRRRLPVVVATHGQPADGYAIRDVKVTPDRVEVSGPASLLRALTEVSTDEVDLSALKEDGEFQVGLDLKKGALTASRGANLTVSVLVAPVVKERRFDGVPVLVRDDGRYATRVPTVSVTLTGPADRVDAIGADEVSVLVFVPGEGEAHDLTVRAGRGPGAHFEVVHPGGESVTVASVRPDGVPVGPR